MKTCAFAVRNAKEMLRDKINLIFGIGFPIVLLLLLSAIQANVPVSLFEIGHLTPGIAVFGLSFISLFSATLIAKDRSSSFMMRLFTSPLTPMNFILGYALPLLPMAIAQIAVCFIAAIILGIEISIHILTCIVVLIPAAILFIGLGLLCGSIFTDKQVGGICGALLTNLTAWLSGTWFDIGLVGGAFEKIAHLLPFIHAVNAGRSALSGNYGDIFPDLWWVIGYAVVAVVAASLVLAKKINSPNN